MTLMIGSKRGQLTIVELLPGRKAKCLCDCGNETVVWRCNLRPNNTTSCGCIHKKKTSEANTRHGRCGERVYRIWVNMKTRCGNPKATQYEYYGGRGIKVCDRWSTSFSAFLDDMGDPPSEDHTIDRIDVNGDYAPKNCRWSTMQTQSQNRRACRWHKRPSTINGN